MHLVIHNSSNIVATRTARVWSFKYYVMLDTVQGIYMHMQIYTESLKFIVYTVHTRFKK